MHPGDSKNIENITLKIGRVEQSFHSDVELWPESNLIRRRRVISSRRKTSSVSPPIGRDATELVRILLALRSLRGGSVRASTTIHQQRQPGRWILRPARSQLLRPMALLPARAQSRSSPTGASTTDPANDTSSISNVNMEMVAEVKVQTSNFGPTAPNGPVVIMPSVSRVDRVITFDLRYVRNSALNSNDWIDNYFDNPRAGTYNYFPGANVGGPVKIPALTSIAPGKMTFLHRRRGLRPETCTGNTATLSFVLARAC